MIVNKALSFLPPSTLAPPKNNSKPTFLVPRLSPPFSPLLTTSTTPPFSSHLFPMSSPSPSISTTTITTTAPPPGITELDSFTRLFLFIIFLTLFIRLCYIYISTRSSQSHNTTTSTSHGNRNTTTGLPYDIINSYHTFRYSKNVAAASSNHHDTTCSICISDYRESEMLRMMPQCRHYFHRDCVDAWLKVNGSCPICRNSPLQVVAIPLPQNASNRM